MAKNDIKKKIIKELLNQDLTEGNEKELIDMIFNSAILIDVDKTEDESRTLLHNALTSEKGLGPEQIELSDGVEKALIDLAGGDARHLLNILEMASDLAAPVKTGGKILTLAMVGAVAGRKMINYDKGGDAYYELISAFHKSVRGSSPDAALYWYARILEAGGDPLYVARRLLAIATEDIGLADPRAMTVCLNAWDIFDRVGAYEGERAIAEAAVYCALAPKSNHLYVAFHEAREDAKQNGDLEVPIYLRNAPTKLMENLGYETGYRYVHDYFTVTCGLDAVNRCGIQPVPCPGIWTALSSVPMTRRKWKHWRAMARFRSSMA